ncbi:hypothetical protein BUALT_Bualt13G0063800 [Buddleja alternifolia]|uniref:GDSL esterase/lipase n=1 Tax=Buddleja alternifolia TaxID=168488 RepID=A0AAV6WSG8_9LAMI|nr:hypothetical protein BUALT_Bualt13G0063800 [Buddleja alternifolia]
MYAAENLGFTSYPPAYLSKKARGNNLLIGANFASGSSGYYDTTAEIYNTVSLSMQVELYKDYQRKLVGLVGKINASSIINGSVHFVSSGSSDFVQNYYVNPLQYKKYTTDQFSDILLQSYTKFVQPLHDLVTKPTDYGFFEARKACCGTGLLETSILCNSESPGTCKNASEYVFWDGFHPSEAANKKLSDDLLAAGISLIS